jgi:hypothetical protein
MRLCHYTAVLLVTTSILTACNDQTDPLAPADAGLDPATTEPDAAVEDGKESSDATSQDGDGGPQEVDVAQDRRPEDSSLDASLDHHADREPDVAIDHPATIDGTTDGDANPLPDATATCFPGIKVSPTRFKFSTTLPDGAMDRCWLTSDGGLTMDVHRTVSGVVRSMSSTGPERYALTIDTCVGDACGPQNAVFDMTSPVPFTLPTGAFVEADYWIAQSHECSYFVRVSNLPELGGVKNPVSNTSKIYFLVSNGYVNPAMQMAPVGVTVDLLGLRCPAYDGGRGCAAVPIDTYAFKFTQSGSDLTVAMGQSLPWTVNGQNMLVENLRSYQDELCDDDWNWSFVFQDR